MNWEKLLSLKRFGDTQKRERKEENYNYYDVIHNKSKSKLLSDSNKTQAGQKDFDHDNKYLYFKVSKNK